MMMKHWNTFNIQYGWTTEVMLQNIKYYHSCATQQTWSLRTQEVSKIYF